MGASLLALAKSIYYTGVTRAILSASAILPVRKTN